MYKICLRIDNASYLHVVEHTQCFTHAYKSIGDDSLVSSLLFFFFFDIVQLNRICISILNMFFAVHSFFPRFWIFLWFIFGFVYYYCLLLFFFLRLFVGDSLDGIGMLVVLFLKVHRILRYNIFCYAKTLRSSVYVACHSSRYYAGIGLVGR